MIVFQHLDTLASVSDLTGNDQSSAADGFNYVNVGVTA
jgi:hypothetical protein